MPTENHITNLHRTLSQYPCALKAGDVARLFNLDKLTVYKYARTGRIKSFRIGGCLRFNPADLAAYVDGGR